MSLPKVFQNNNNIIESHNQEVYRSNTSEKKSNNRNNVVDEINKMFFNKTFINKVNVEITRNNNTYKTTIIGKSSNYLISINNELIPIKEIENIKKVD